jgi:hypothetical protein
MKNNFDYIILTNPHREPLAVSHFEKKNPKIFLSQDWEYTPPNNNFSHGNEVGHYRAFRSHCEGLMMMEKDVAFMIEDDCIPDYSVDWENALQSAYSMVTDYGYDVACLYLNPDGGHPRTNGTKITVLDVDWYKPNNIGWFVGLTCYMINKTGAEKFLQGMNFKHRLPDDLYFWQTGIFNYVVSDKLFFIHDRSQGSLIENPK